MRNRSFYYRLLGKKGTEVFRVVMSFLVLLNAHLPSLGEIVPKFLILVLYTQGIFLSPHPSASKPSDAEGVAASCCQPVL